MLKALRMNSEEARLKFPRLLQIIESYPAETMDLMTKEVRGQTRPLDRVVHLGDVITAVHLSRADDLCTLLDADWLDQPDGGAAGQTRSRGHAALRGADCRVLPAGAGLRPNDQQRGLPLPGLGHGAQAARVRQQVACVFQGRKGLRLRAYVNADRVSKSVFFLVFYNRAMIPICA